MFSNWFLDLALPRCVFAATMRFLLEVCSNTPTVNSLMLSVTHPPLGLSGMGLGHTVSWYSNPSDFNGYRIGLALPLFFFVSSSFLSHHHRRLIFETT